MKNRENSDSKQKITLICCAVLIVALLLLGFGEMLNRRAQQNVNKLYDTTVIDYEAYKTRLNDLVLIVLWILASLENKTYTSMVICFVAFLASDLYAFINWGKLEKKQGLTD